MIKNISSVIVEEQTVEFEVNGFPGFKVSLSYMSRDTLRELTKSFTTIKRKRGVETEEVDQEALQNEYIKRIVKGWSGLTVGYLKKLALVKVGKDVNDDEEVEFNSDNAIFLMRASADFDNWVSDKLDSVENFTKSS